MKKRRKKDLLVKKGRVDNFYIRTRRTRPRTTAIAATPDEESSGSAGFVDEGFDPELAGVVEFVVLDSVALEAVAFDSVLFERVEFESVLFDSEFEADFDSSLFTYV